MMSRPFIQQTYTLVLSPWPSSCILAYRISLPSQPRETRADATAFQACQRAMSESVLTSADGSSENTVVSSVQLPYHELLKGPS